MKLKMLKIKAGVKQVVALPLEFTVQLLGTPARPFNSTTLGTAASVPKQYDIHGKGCIHPGCVTPADPTQSHGWLCTFHSLKAR